MDKHLSRKRKSVFESYERLFNSIRSMWQRGCLKDSFSKVFTRITLLAGEMFFLT